MNPAPLADPSRMTPMQRTEELVLSVDQDDLLGVLLVLSFSNGNEANSRSARTGRSPLETTLLAPLRRFDVRRLIAECLLHHGADPDQVLLQSNPTSTDRLADVLRGWKRGGREQATAAYDLRFRMSLVQAEAYLKNARLDVASLPPPALPPRNGIERSPVIASRPPPGPYNNNNNNRHPSGPPYQVSSNNHNNRDHRRSPSPPRRGLPPPPPHRERARSPLPMRHQAPPSPPRRSHHINNGYGLPPRRSPSPPPPRRNSLSNNRPNYHNHATLPPRGDGPAPVPYPSFGHSSNQHQHQLPPPQHHQQQQQQQQQTGRGFWAFVGGMPNTMSERHLFDTMTNRGIKVRGIFLSTSPKSRFAFVELENDVEGRRAIESFAGLRVDGRALVARPFKNKDGGDQPDSHIISKQDVYVGTQHQADRPLDETRCGITLLHISPRTRQEDVAEFLRPAIPSSNIERIDVKTIGVSTLSFVRLYERVGAREAILKLDGAVFLGHAVRLNWMYTRNPPPDFHGGRRYPESDYNSRPHSPPPKRRRFSVDRYANPTSSAPVPAPSSHTSEKQPLNPLPSYINAASIAPGSTPVAPPEVAASAPPAALASAASAAPSVADSIPSEPVPAPAATETSTDAAFTAVQPPPSLPDHQHDDSHDLAQLRSFGIDESSLARISAIWAPSSSSSSSSSSSDPDRTIDIKARFGFLPVEEAKAALEANQRVRPFGEDGGRQARYEAFLRAQAGESKDYFTVFFAQLFDFNSSSDLFTATARAGLEAAAASAASASSAEVEAGGSGEQQEAAVAVEGKGSEQGAEGMAVEKTEQAEEKVTAE